MLVLTRKAGESIVIDGGIEVKIQRIAGKRVTLAIGAPSDVKILRGEIADERIGDLGRERAQREAVACRPCV